MDTHVFFLIIRNEMKLQMRSWVFRFFVVLSLVGVVVCQMYRQGGDDIHWKMVGLPCSIPLVNAYFYVLSFPFSFTSIQEKINFFKIRQFCIA